MNNFSNVKIRFKEIKNSQPYNKRKTKTIMTQNSMRINLSLVTEYSSKITEVLNNPYELEASINIWRQLYSKQILKFIDEKKYNSSFSRKILHDSYKTLTLLYEHMRNDLIDNDMISYYEPTKKRYYKGKFLNSIIQNNQTIFW
ncbi:MAG: hypothetical protein CL773_05170 [Chloroflexi bacterium]|nr:hypothetical protein [Chloroflexota bacterium]|tara:strand:+ start:9189 stop:9620 length:432 start_codon:yes stop_codon:yes gene_type:complete